MARPPGGYAPTGHPPAARPPVGPPGIPWPSGRASLPPAGPSNRLMVGGLVAALLLVAVIGGGVVRSGLFGRTAAPQPVSTQAAAPPTADANLSPERRRVAIVSALQVMQNAVRDGDEAAFLSVIDPAAPAAFRAHQRLVFSNLKALRGLATFEFSWDTLRWFPVPAARSYSAHGIVAAVSMRYSFTGYDPTPVADVVGLTFAPADGQWYLESDSDADSRLAFGGRFEPWMAGPITVVKRARVLVIGDTEHRKQAERLARRLESALSPVRSMWSTKTWNGRVVAYASTEQAFVTAWFGSAAASGSESDPAAEATFEANVRVLPRDPVITSNDTYQVGSPRLVVTPHLLAEDDAYSRAVLRHELTHVALARMGERRPPTWLIEGVAEYTAFRHARSSGTDGVAALAERGLRRETWSQLKSGSWKPRLISADDDFYSGTEAQVDDAYTTAWFTCLYIADHFGEAKLRSLYETAAGAPKLRSDANAEADSLRSVLHLSRSQLQTRVRSYARRLRTHFV